MERDDGIPVDKPDDEQLEVQVALRKPATERKASLGEIGHQQTIASIHTAFESKANDPQALFNSVDEDHSGNIDFEEFQMLYHEIREHAASEALKEADAKRQIEMQQQRAKFLKGAVVTLLIGLVAMLAGNMGLTMAVVFLSKDTSVGTGGVMTVMGSDQPVRVGSADFSVAANEAAPPVTDPARRRLQASSSSAMVGANGAIVEVKQARVEVPLFAIPAMEDAQLARITSLTVSVDARPATAAWTSGIANSTSAPPSPARRQLDGSSPPAVEEGAQSRRRISTVTLNDDQTVGTVPQKVKKVVAIASADSESPTSIVLEAQKAGVSVTIRDGLAEYHDVSDPQNPFHSTLCIATVSCAAVSVRADEAEQLTLAAITAIVDAGLAVQPSMVGYWTGLTGSNHTPWARQLEAADGRQLQGAETTSVLCDNSCASPGISVNWGPQNGKCEDSGVGSVMGDNWNKCEFGTDCDDCGERKIGCGKYEDKRRAWCVAGWVRMKGGLDDRLSRIWGDNFNMFYAYGAILVATDWWRSPDGTTMLPIFASWKWYTPDKPEAYLCAIAYIETELFGAGGTEMMYGTNPLCAREQRGKMLGAAAKCINEACKADGIGSGEGCCQLDTERPPSKVYKNGENDPDTGYAYRFASDSSSWTCDSAADWKVSSRAIGSMPGYRTWPECSDCVPGPPYAMADYFEFVGGIWSPDPCATQVKAARDLVDNRDAIRAAACIAHDPYGGVPTWIKEEQEPFNFEGAGSPERGYAAPLGYFTDDAEKGFKKASFWDGTSEADISYSDEYGVELPAFNGHGYADGQGPMASRREVCYNTFDVGYGFEAVFGTLGDVQSEEVSYGGEYVTMGGRVTKKFELIDTGLRNARMMKSEFFSGDVDAMGQYFTSETVKLFGSVTSDPNANVLFMKRKPGVSQSGDLQLMAEDSISLDTLQGWYHAPISQNKFMGTVNSFVNCMREVKNLESKETCESIGFTQSVWRGKAPAGQQPGWECIEDLGADKYTSQCSVCSMTAVAAGRELGEGKEVDHTRVEDKADTVNKVDRAFEEAVLGHNRRKLRHGCANSRSGCRVLPPPRR